MTIPHEAIHPRKAVRPNTPFHWNSNMLYKSWAGERVANGWSKMAHTVIAILIPSLLAHRSPLSRRRRSLHFLTVEKLGQSLHRF